MPGQVNQQSGGGGGGGDMLAANNLSDVVSATASAHNLGVGTADSPQFTAVNVGHATDTTVARSAAGKIAVEAKAVPLMSGAVDAVFTGPTTAHTYTLPDADATFLVSGGALGTPASGTLSSCSGLPVSGITASTSTALGVGSIELGHATDTTIARTGAGDISVEGNAVYRAGGTDVPVTDGGTGSSTAAGAATNLGLGTGDSVTHKDLTLTKGTITTDVNVLSGTVTWNDAGTTFTAIKLNVTDTASPVPCNLVDLKVGNVTKWSVSKQGGVGFFGLTAPTSQPLAIGDPSGGATQDAEARTAIQSVLGVLRGNGMIAT